MSVAVRFLLPDVPGAGSPWAEPPVVVRRPGSVLWLASARSLDAAARWGIATGARPLGRDLRQRAAALALDAWLDASALDTPPLP